MERNLQLVSSSLKTFDTTGRRENRFDSFAAILTASATESVVSEQISESSLLNLKFFKRLVTALVTNGIAMSIAGSSRQYKGVEHLISHALDQLSSNPKPHGIQVGITTIFTNALRGNFWQKLKNLYHLIGFSTSPVEVQITKELFLKTVDLAPSIRNERYNILNKVGKNRYNSVSDQVFTSSRKERPAVQTKTEKKAKSLFRIRRTPWLYCPTLGK
jgi:glycerol-1-phosphate dehydrogenase [NAD(P)+]